MQSSNRFALFSVPLGAALAISSTPLSASPADVNAEEFYRTAKELSGKGMKAMFDKRTRPTMEQMKDAGLSAKAENEAAKKRNAPLYCVSDAQRKKGLNPQQAVEMLGRVPEAQRKRLSLKQAWKIVLVREYPCT